MTKRIKPFLCTTIAAILISACGAPADDRPKESASPEAAKPIADPPTANTSVYVREGDDWKLAFTLNDLSNYMAEGAVARRIVVLDE